MLHDTPVGMLQLSPEEDAQIRAGRIPFLFILPEYRYQNLGVQLLGEAVSVYRKLNRERLLLRCAPDNYPAIRFYLKHGFKKIGSDPGVRKPLYVLSKSIVVP
jgi:probable phosphoglycerate mutase